MSSFDFDEYYDHYPPPPRIPRSDSRVRVRVRQRERSRSPSVRYISPPRQRYIERGRSPSMRSISPTRRRYEVPYRRSLPSPVPPYITRRISYPNRSSDTSDTSDGYSPFTYDKLETKGLSQTYMIPKIFQQPNDLTEGTINSQWQDFESAWDDKNDGNVSLHVVHASEYSVNKDGREKIKLVCPARIDTIPAESPVIQMKWIHLKRQCLRFDILKKLLVKSPFISQELRQVAGKVVEEVQTNHSHETENGQSFHPQPGSVFRCIGKHDAEGTSETPPVMFVSGSYLVLSKKPPLSGLDKGYYMMSLLQSLYGFDVGGDQEHPDVARKMDLGVSNDELHVPQLWCLLVGSDLLITFSELSLEDLRENLVEIDLKASLLEKPLTLQVRDDNMRHYNIVIDAGSNYVDFLRDAVALARRPGWDATDYDVLDESMETITPQRWLKLLKSGKIEQTIFYVMPKILYQSHHRVRSRVREYSRDPDEYYSREGDRALVRRAREREDLDDSWRYRLTYRATKFLLASNHFVA